MYILLVIIVTDPVTILDPPI